MSEKPDTETIDVAAVEQQAAKSAIQLSTENRGKNRRSPIAGRKDLPRARRVVVKVGSSSLTSIENSIDENALRNIVDALGRVKAQGVDVIFVSSGAITAGLSPLGLAKRPKDLATKQAAASVGQGLLISRYTEYFARYGVAVGQVLLTAEDLMRHSQYKNAHRQIERLLDLNVLPIVNENDAVATHEIKFGDNDRIAALIAHLVKADALLLLSDVDALYTKPPQDGGERIATIEDPIEDLKGVEIGTIGRAGVGSGGMVTKVQAARIAASSGIPALVTSATNIERALGGQDVGTWFATTGGRRSVRLLWLAHLADIKGSLILDAGAVAAVRGRRSLLAAGVTGLSGKFSAGDPVSMVDENGQEVAHGLVNYGSDEVPGMLGKRTYELGEELGEDYARELVHVDNLVTIRKRGARTRLKRTGV